MVMMTMALHIKVDSTKSDTADTWNIFIDVQVFSTTNESFDDGRERVKFVHLFSSALSSVSRRNDKSV